MLRSCYRAKMRFFRDDPGKETIIQWYFVDDQTKYVSVPTVFRSRLYERDLPQLPIGELIDFHPYSPGAAPVDVDGPTFCGTPEQWLLGALSSDPVPPIDPDTGVQICCGPAALFFKGAVVVGGSAEFFSGLLFSFRDAIETGGTSTLTLIQPLEPSGSLAGGLLRLTGGLITLQGGSTSGGGDPFMPARSFLIQQGSSSGGGDPLTRPRIFQTLQGSTPGGPPPLTRPRIFQTLQGSTPGGGDPFIPARTFPTFQGSGSGGGDPFIPAQTFLYFQGSGTGGGDPFIPAQTFLYFQGSGSGGGDPFFPPGLFICAGGSTAGDGDPFIPPGNFLFAGGSQTGGAVTLPTIEVKAGSGGVLVDGTVTKTESVSVACCPDPVAVSLVLEITRTDGTCDCLPSEIPMVWDGFQWQGQSVSNTCGIDTSDWHVICESIMEDVWILNYGEDELPAAFEQCTPLQIDFTDIFPTWCTGSFDARLREP